MAVYRTIHTCFWTDPKVAEDFTANERLLYLFLLTGPSTNLSGCYEITTKQISFFTGLNNPKDLLKSLQKKHGVISYSEATKEVLILNWWHYNWTGSEKFRKALYDDITSIKEPAFRDYLMKRFLSPDTVSETSDTVSAVGEYGIKNTVSVSVRDSVSVSDVLEDNSVKSKKQKFIPPTEEQVAAYCREKGYGVAAADFVNFYESKGWMVGSNKMVDWHKALAGWESRKTKGPPKKKFNFDQHTDYNDAEIEAALTARM